MVHGAHSSATAQNQLIHPSSKFISPLEGSALSLQHPRKRNALQRENPACWYFGILHIILTDAGVQNRMEGGWKVIHNISIIPPALPSAQHIPHTTPELL